MADLSTLTAQERALLAQYLAVKSGGVGNAPALMQMVFDRLASGTFGSTLIEVIADLLPEGIPLGTDFSAYLPLVQGQPAAPPVTPPVYAGGQGGGGESSVGEPFDWSSFGARAPSRPLMPSQPAAPAPSAAPAPAAPAPQAGQPAQTDDTGLFGFEMSPEIPPQADPGYLKGPNPLFPDLPRPDPRRTAALPSYDPGTPVAEPAPTARPTPINPPELPVLDPVLTADGYTGPQPDERLVSPALQIDPTATDDPFRFIGNPRVGRLSEEYTRPIAPTPLRTTSVQPVSVNPQTGGPVDFGALLESALSRDLTGPLGDDGDRAISALSVLAPALAPTQSAPLSAPGAGVSPQQRDAIRAVPPPDPFYIPPAPPKPALDEWVLRDWIEQRGFDQQPAPESGFRTLSPPPQTSSKSLDGAPGRQAANTTYAPVPAPLPLARMAVAATLPEGTVQLSAEDRELLARAIATEVDPRVARMDPAAYQQQVYRTLDVMLNRVASTEFPNSVVDVLNQPRQFSAITGPRRPGRERYGDVQNIPEDRADPELRQMVENWIREREGGAPSSVGGALHYANPQAADASNMQWIMALDGPRDDAGPFSHWYGTTDGFTPTEAVLSDQPSWLTTKPQTPISTTAAVQAEKLRNKNSIDFNLAVQAAAAEQTRPQQEASKIAQSYTSQTSTGDPFNYDKQVGKAQNPPGGGGSSGGGSSSVGDPFDWGSLNPSKTTNTPKPSTSGGGYTAPTKNPPSSSGAGKLTNSSSGKSPSNSSSSAGKLTNSSSGKKKN